MGWGEKERSAPPKAPRLPKDPTGAPVQEAKVIITQDAQGHAPSEARPRAQVSPCPGGPGPNWRGWGGSGTQDLEEPPPILLSVWCLLASLLPFFNVHVGRVVAMTPRAGGRLWLLSRPNPHAQSPGGRGAAAAPPPLVQRRAEIGRRPLSHTPEARRVSSSWKGSNPDGGLGVSDRSSQRGLEAFIPAHPRPLGVRGWRRRG